MPNCPTQEGCSCRIPTIFNNDYKIVQDKKNYIVEVNCAGRDLKHFPLLPKWTKTLDLSDNNVSIARFFSSRVTKNHMTKSPYPSALDFLNIQFTKLIFELDFLNIQFTKLIFELDFLSVSNLIFTACVVCKNPIPEERDPCLLETKQHLKLILCK